MIETEIFYLLNQIKKLTERVDALEKTLSDKEREEEDRNEKTLSDVSVNNEIDLTSYMQLSQCVSSILNETFGKIMALHRIT